MTIRFNEAATFRSRKSSAPHSPDMQTIQRQRERENRQINELLRTLIAAYKILGGSFTGELSFDPAHLRSLRQQSGNQTQATESLEASVEMGSAFVGSLSSVLCHEDSPSISNSSR